jgi:hypothetical protein
LRVFALQMALYTNTIFVFAPPPAASVPVLGFVMIALFAIGGAALYWAAGAATARSTSVKLSSPTS